LPSNAEALPPSCNIGQECFVALIFCQAWKLLILTNITAQPLPSIHAVKLGSEDCKPINICLNLQGPQYLCCYSLRNYRLPLPSIRRTGPLLPVWAASVVSCYVTPPLLANVTGPTLIISYHE